MIDLFGFPQGNSADVQIYDANSLADGVGWTAWTKPRGATMLHVFLLGGAGNGGRGAVGAASTAAGGGGGGAGGVTSVFIPLIFLPDVLYISVGYPTIKSYVSIYPTNSRYMCLAMAYNGSSGGDASGATAGTTGTASIAAQIANDCTLAAMGSFFSIGGQFGATGNGVSIAVPTTGSVVTAGASGGALPAANTAGHAGGDITGSGVFITLPGGGGGATTPTAGKDGSNGLDLAFNGKLGFRLGGAGGGSGGVASGGASGGAGGNGGMGAPGCGGGGGGGGFTGSAQSLGGLGGQGICIMTAW